RLAQPPHRQAERRRVQQRPLLAAWIDRHHVQPERRHLDDRPALERPRAVLEQLLGETPRRLEAKDCAEAWLAQVALDQQHSRTLALAERERQVDGAGGLALALDGAGDDDD